MPIITIPNGIKGDDYGRSPLSSEESMPEDDVSQLTTTMKDLSKLDYTDIPGYKKMRVAIWQTAAGLKAPSGGYRGNYALAQALTAHGHEVMQFCWSHPGDIEEAIHDLKTARMYRPNQIKRGHLTLIDDDEQPVKVPWTKMSNIHSIRYVALDAKIMIDTLENTKQCEDAAVHVETGKAPKRLKPYLNWFIKNLEEFQATHVIFNDIVACKATEMMLTKNPKLVRFEVVHTAEQIPTGPYAGGCFGSATTPVEFELWQKLDGIVAVSHAIRRYAADQCGVEMHMIPNHPWSFKDRKSANLPRRRRNFDDQTVVMINPCMIKGYGIFLDMAKENKRRRDDNTNLPIGLANRPSYNYVAYATWGAKPEMRDELRAAGVEVRNAATDMEPVWDHVSLLIVPSLWFEAWGLVITEAQLRGIPVVASKVGGIGEAKRFVGPLIKVNQIDGRQRAGPGHYQIPPQDVSPWIEAVDELMTDRDHYYDVADAGYAATRDWVQNQDIRAFEKLLLAKSKQ